MAGEITILLNRWRDGDADAYQQLVPYVYPHLRGVAATYLNRESPGHTLQATALVHELYLRLLQQRKAEWQDRAHFYTFAAKMMRLILTDYARAAGVAKRGGHFEHVPLDRDLPFVELTGGEVIDLNRGLEELEAVDPRKVRLVELRYFLGCTTLEAAEVLEISTATAERDLALARSWLHARLTEERGAIEGSTAPYGPFRPYDGSGGNLLAWRDRRQRIESSRVRVLSAWYRQPAST